MLFSNVFLILPVILAAFYHQWLYCFFAAGIVIFSPLFHWYRLYNQTSPLYEVFKVADWAFAVGAFIYMYYYIYKHVPAEQKVILFVLLTLVVVFFWYGWQRGDYSVWHPWFHIIAPLISSAILIAANSSNILRG